jgi:alpha-1,2-mannosyltransferase
MTDTKINKNILIVIMTILLLSTCIFIIQSFNKESYFLTQGNLPFVKMVLNKNLGDDSWEPMDIAYEYFEEHGKNAPIYTNNLIERNIRFQYPPATLFITHLANKLHSQFNLSKKFFYGACSYFFLFITSLMIYLTLHHAILKNRQSQLHVSTKLQLFLFVSLLTILYFPILQGAYLGNIQTWLNAFFAVALFCILKNKYLLAGALIGLVAMVKPQFGLLIIWALVRREWKFATGFFITFTLVSISAVVVYGLENHIDYLNAISFLSKHGESFHNNQSMNGLINRFFSISQPNLYNNLNWENIYQPFPPYNPWVYFGTILTSISILFLCLAFRPAKNENQRLVDFCLMSLGLTIASPIVWIYHYGVILPIYGILLTILCYQMSETRANRSIYILLNTLFILTSLSIPFVEYTADSYFNFLQSYYYFSTLGIFAVIYILRRNLSDSTNYKEVSQP